MLFTKWEITISTLSLVTVPRFSIINLSCMESVSSFIELSESKKSEGVIFKFGLVGIFKSITGSPSSELVYAKTLYAFDVPSLLNIFILEFKCDKPIFLRLSSNNDS